MAHLWTRESSAGEWSPVALIGDALDVSPGMLLRRASVEPEVWVLVSSSAVHVNGARLSAGIRILCDRDELRAGGHRSFFSTESLAKIVPFPGADRPVFCARCKLEIAAGTPAVRCPRCTVWHHQTEQLPCWTYSPQCAICDQPSALDAGFVWSPEEL
jgi:hypothetical protein